MPIVLKHFLFFLIKERNIRCHPYLDKGWVKIHVVGHDDCTNNTHSLEQGSAVIRFVPWNEHSIHDFSLVRSNNNILKELKNKKKKVVKWVIKKKGSKLEGYNTVKKNTSYPKAIAITLIRKPKSNSNLRSPYLSRSRNVKVSTAVINTPAHNGILLKHKLMLGSNRYTAFF